MVSGSGCQNFNKMSVLDAWKKYNGNPVRQRSLCKCRFLMNVNTTCCRPSVCRLSLPVVCNVRVPYSASYNFQQYFYAIWYHAIHWHPRKILRRSSQVNSVGGLNARRVAKYSDFDLSKVISRKRCKIGGTLVVSTNRKSHMSFQLVQKSVTLVHEWPWPP